MSALLTSAAFGSKLIKPGKLQSAMFCVIIIIFQKQFPDTVSSYE